MCDNNLLISYGVGRGTKYKINEDYLHVLIANDASNDASRKAKRSVNMLKQEILIACEDYISIEDIAIRVKRSLSHLKDRIIPQMLRENLIERQYPDIPRHPHQKYRAVKK